MTTDSSNLLSEAGLQDIQDRMDRRKHLYENVATGDCRLELYELDQQQPSDIESLLEHIKELESELRDIAAALEAECDDHVERTRAPLSGCPGVSAFSHVQDRLLKLSVWT